MRRRMLRQQNLSGTEDGRFLVGLAHGLDIAIVGFATSGFFITVLYYPFFWVLLILSVCLRSAAGGLVFSSAGRSMEKAGRFQ